MSRNMFENDIGSVKSVYEQIRLYSETMNYRT